MKQQFGAQSSVVREGAAETIANQGIKGIPLIKEILLNSEANPYQTLTAIRTLNKLEPTESAMIGVAALEKLLLQSCLRNHRFSLPKVLGG
ncbi:MAG: hypothetical protein V3W34_13215 [Phycisphaerae bacterium]